MLSYLQNTLGDSHIHLEKNFVFVEIFSDNVLYCSCMERFVIANCGYFVHPERIGWNRHVLIVYWSTAIGP